MTEIKNISNDQIYKALMNLTTQNSEIKEEIKALKENLEIKTIEISRKYEKLEEENRELKLKLRISERRAKKNNIIIFGCQEIDNEDTLPTVLKLVNEKLDTKLTVQEVNNTYRIGDKNSSKIRPIRLELTSYLKKIEILSQGRRLKGSNIYLRDDLTPEDLEERKLLTKHLIEARKKKIPAKIQNFKLIVNGEAFSYEDLKDTPLDEDVDKTSITPTSYISTLFPEVFDIRDKERSTKSKCPQQHITSNAKGISHHLSGVHHTKLSSGDNVRHSERLANSANKKP